MWLKRDTQHRRSPPFLSLLHSALLLLLLLLVSAVSSGEDFYDLLGIGRQANNREIRRAFKKLALKMHPDKNQDDPDASNKFIRINRAYEVLKDEELRRKYDQHGEEGLDESNQGRNYENWHFYNQEFGLYDEDPEVITLSRSDFDPSVTYSEDIWFINFYSPRCSHCHTLAPSWREMARELDGVIRIGAVNCADERQLCQMQGVHGYPSLILFPNKLKYQGDRTTRELVKFAMGHVHVSVADLWEGNFREQTEAPKRSGKPWLLSVSKDDDSDALDQKTSLKVAGVVGEIINVGTIDCELQVKLCSTLGLSRGGIFFFEDLGKSEPRTINALHFKEVAHAVLSLLPDKTEELTENRFRLIREKLRLESTTTAWLIQLVDKGEQTEKNDVELRKLPSLLGDDIKAGRLDCAVYRSLCHSLYVFKYPTFILLKYGGGFEVHYGRKSAHDVAGFAKENAFTSVVSFGEQEFNNAVYGGNNIAWFVDFFAPWCPPCMQLLPEFRKAARTQDRDQIRFATVDCTVHGALCNKYNIRSYPTTVLYNNTKPNMYGGHHTSHYIAEFIEDNMNPPVEVLTPETFRSKVGGKTTEQLWLVDFFAPWCGPCQQLAPEWRRLAKSISGTAILGSLDCDMYQNFCSQEMNVRSYPTIRLYPIGSAGASRFMSYDGYWRDAQSLKAWVFQSLPSTVTTLTQKKFYSSVLPSSQPWIIDFYAPWCGHCRHFEPQFELVSRKMANKVKAGKVNCDDEKNLCENLGIDGYPTIRVYSGSRSSEQSQSVYGEEVNSQDSDYIISYLSRKFGQPEPEQNFSSKSHDEL